MSDTEIVKFIKRHPDLRNDYKLEDKTISVPIASNHFSDRKFFESLINGFDNYFAITGRYLIIYKEGND